MNINLNIDVHHLTRVEGHGNIKVVVENGAIKEARWDVVETPRFFEALLRGKHYSTAGILTARICGICSIGHCLASLRATEAAFGITVSEVAQKLRLLAKHGETLQSHVLHLFFLVAPDFFNLPSAISLLEKETKVYDLSRRLKSLAGHLYETAAQDNVSAHNDPMHRRGMTPPHITNHELKEEIESALLGLAETIAPELIGLSSVKPFLSGRPGVVSSARRLKGIANEMCDVVAGRATHPVSLQVGGMAVAPGRERLRKLQSELKRALDDLAVTVDVCRSLTTLDFVRETEFVSLKGEDTYAFMGEVMISSDGVELPAARYREMTNEYIVEPNTSKWCRLSRESLAVGALARVINNYNLLHPEAQKVARALNLKPPIPHNPFLNNVAQLVECVHVTHESIRLIDELLGSDLSALRVPVTPREGEGVGVVEVPRGILYHHYTYDRAGIITAANCIIPTTQNNANIHYDMHTLVEQYASKGMTNAQMELLCSMLVRAYDPCISCSVH